MKTAVRLLAVFLAVSASLAGAMTPLRIEQTVEARFPQSLALTPISEGEARVVINVDADGRLVDWLVVGYTHKAFADEAVYVLKQWRFEAPTENGQRTGVRTELRFAFAATARVVSLTAIETPDVLLKQMGVEPHYTAAVCRLEDLDRPLAPINPTSPLYPAPPRVTGRQSVVVDFYVDEKGQPRMPVVVNSSHHNYALPVLDALNRWRFTTPTRAGRPISVRVRQEFVFPDRT